MTESQLIDYFNEHVCYEWLMVRYSKKCLEAWGTQLCWNAMFSAFNVSARNLYSFLNNKGERTDINVHDYDRYRNSSRYDSVSDVHGTLGKLNAQCFHMGRERFKEPDKKIKLGKIAEVSDWIEKNMDSLVESFKEEFRPRIKLEQADLVTQMKVLNRIVGPHGSTSSSLGLVFDVAPMNKNDAKDVNKQI